MLQWGHYSVRLMQWVNLSVHIRMHTKCGPSLVWTQSKPTVPWTYGFALFVKFTMGQISALKSWSYCCNTSLEGARDGRWGDSRGRGTGHDISIRMSHRIIDILEIGRYIPIFGNNHEIIYLRFVPHVQKKYELLDKCNTFCRLKSASAPK